MAEYINLAWPPTYRVQSFQQGQQAQQSQQPQQQHSHAHQQQQQLQQQQQPHQFAIPNGQNPNINPHAGPSSRPQQAYAYAQYPVASSSPSTLLPGPASTSTSISTPGSTSGATPAPVASSSTSRTASTSTSRTASTSTSTAPPPAFRAPAHKHAHHLHSIPPREKSTRTLIIDHMLWVHGRTRFAQARAELGMTDRTGGPSSVHYTHRRRPESYAESDDELSAGEDTQPLRARQGDPGNPHADAEDARKGRQDLGLARSLRLRAEGVEKVVIGMLEGGPGGGGVGAAGNGTHIGAGRPGIGRTGTGNSRTPGSGSSPNRLPNGVRLRLALGTIINDLFARQAPPPPYRHTHPTHSSTGAGASPSTTRTSGSTPMSAVDPGDDDEELPRALWTLAPVSAAFVRPRRARRKNKAARGHGYAQAHTQGPSPSFSGHPHQMASMTSTPAAAYMDYSAQFPPPQPTPVSSSSSAAGGAQWHQGYQGVPLQQPYSSQQYHGQSPQQYQQYGPINQPTPPGQQQQRPGSSSSSMSMHPRPPSSSSSSVLTPPIAHYQSPPHHLQRQHSHPYVPTPPTHTHTQHTPAPGSHAHSHREAEPSVRPHKPLPKPSARVMRLYSVGADPDTANSPPGFRCPRHLHTGCEICVEAKAPVGAISAKGHGGPRDTRVVSPGGGPAGASSSSADGANRNSTSAQTHTYAPGAGSSYGAAPSQGLNSWRGSGGGGITGWQDGSGIGSGLLRPGVRGSALRRKTVMPGYGGAASTSLSSAATPGGSADGGAGGGRGSGDEGRGAGNTKLSRLIPRFIRLSALVAAEVGRESRGEEVGVGPANGSALVGVGGAGQGSAEGRDRDTPSPPNARRSPEANITPRQQRQRANTAGSSTVTPTRASFAQAHGQGPSTSSPSSSPVKDRESAHLTALQPTTEWYMLLAGLLTRAVLEGYLTGGWRGLRAVQCLLMVGLGVGVDDGSGSFGEGGVRRKGRSERDVSGSEDDGNSASDSDEGSEDDESSTDASTNGDGDDDENLDTDADADARPLGLGFRLPVSGGDDAADAANGGNEDEDEEFAELDPDELPDLVEAVRVLFPSLRRWGGKGKGKRRADVDQSESGDEQHEGKEGVKGDAEAEYEEEMLERLRRFYAIPESTPDCATHMEDLAWQYPAEPVERAAVRFCEAIARWRGKPELETYKNKPSPNGAQRDAGGDTGGMSIDALVHSNPVSPTMGAAHVQQQQAEMQSISAALDDPPRRKKRQPAIEDYFTGASVAKHQRSQSGSPERDRSQQGQYQAQQHQGPNESPSWARSGGGPNKRFRDIADDAGRAEKRMYA